MKQLIIINLLLISSLFSFGQGIEIDQGKVGAPNIIYEDVIINGQGRWDWRFKTLDTMEISTATGAKILLSADGKVEIWNGRFPQIPTLSFQNNIKYVLGVDTDGNVGFVDTASYTLSDWLNTGNDIYNSNPGNVLIGSSTGNGARLFVLGAPTTGTEIATFRSQTSLTDTRYQNSTTGSTNNDGTRVRQTGNNFSIQNLESTGTIQIGINNSVDLAITVDHDVQIENDIIYDATNSIRAIKGTGSPEGAVNGGAGSTYRQTDGSAGTIQWIKETGTGNTGWVPNGINASTTASTNGSGDITITHGLGYAPTKIILTSNGTTFYHLQYHNITSTTFDIRVFDASGSAVASTSVALTYWAR